jgi:hypothetical protein
MLTLDNPFSNLESSMKGRVFKNQGTLFLNATFLETLDATLGQATDPWASDPWTYPNVLANPVDSLSLRPRPQWGEPSLFFLAPRQRLKHYLVFVGADEMQQQPLWVPLVDERHKCASVAPS